jgi:hypothetical protein
MSFNYYVGLDLGQAADSTALAIIEAPLWTPQTGWVSGAEIPRDVADQYNTVLGHHWRQAAPTPVPLWLRTLYRYPLNTPYPTIVADVIRRLGGKDAYRTDAVLVVDGTGVGAPVVDMFRFGEVPCTLYPVLITGGNKKEKNHVPKRDLIGALQVALQRSQLQIAKQTTDTEALLQEMQNYRVKIDERTAHDSYNARQGKHDDLVLAVALAAWFYGYTHMGE